MSYPSIITGGQGASLGGTAIGDFEFEYNSSRYCCLVDNANVATPKLHFYKSTDSGETWSELDSAGAPTFNLGGPSHPSYTLARDGTTVLVLWIRVNSTPVAVGATRCNFDLAGEAWGSPANISAPVQLAVSQESRALIHLIVRGAGDYILLYSGTKASASGRVSYSTYDGNAIGAEVQISSQTAGINYLPVGGAYDATSGVTLFVYREGADNSSSGKIWVIGLSSGNSFGTPVQVVSSADASWYMIAKPIRFLVAGVAYFGFANTLLTGGNYVIKWQSCVAALTPTFAAAETVFSGSAASSQNVPFTETNMPSTGNAKTVSVGFSSTKILVVWTAWLYDEVDQPYAYNYSISAIGSGVWSSVAVLFEPVAVSVPSIQKASQIYVSVDSLGIGVVGVSYDSEGLSPQEPQFFILVDSARTVSVSDALALVDSLTGIYCSSLNSFGDILALGDSLGPGPSVDVVSGDGNSGEVSGSSENVFNPSCMFEFYGLERPESVEVLPVPKKFDQVLGRFDKIGKVFGFRVRLIQNGSVVLMPFSVFGDDSRTADPINAAPLYSGSFVVRPGRDNVYEIQFPKSVNTDILRLTLGPVSDSFHRYDVLLKVQTSGMEGESRWMPIR